MLPSEAQLVREFGASRSTVVRALEYLRQHGWLHGVQGKGRIVLHRPLTDLRRSPGRALQLLHPHNIANVGTPTVTREGASTTIATVLALPVGAPLVARRSLLRREPVGLLGMSVTYVPVELAATVDLGTTDGLLAALRAAGRPAGQAVERLGVRLPTLAEAASLRVQRRHCLLTILLAVLDSAGQPLIAVDTVLSRDLPELITITALT